MQNRLSTLHEFVNIVEAFLNRRQLNRFFNALENQKLAFSSGQNPFVDVVTERRCRFDREINYLLAGRKFLVPLGRDLFRLQPTSRRSTWRFRRNRFAKTPDSVFAGVDLTDSILQQILLRILLTYPDMTVRNRIALRAPSKSEHHQRTGMLRVKQTCSADA